MSKSRKRLDPRQTAFDFEAQIATYQAARESVLEPPAPALVIDSIAEASIEIAATLKKMIRGSGLSRDQAVDKVNVYFGEPQLTIHMLNHYLSKPTQYPIPGFYFFALQHVTSSLALAELLGQAQGARVISGAEVRQMALGRLDEMISEMQRLKKELKGGR